MTVGAVATTAGCTGSELLPSRSGSAADDYDQWVPSPGSASAATLQLRRLGPLADATEVNPAAERQTLRLEDSFLGEGLELTNDGLRVFQFDVSSDPPLGGFVIRGADPEAAESALSSQSDLYSRTTEYNGHTFYEWTDGDRPNVGFGRSAVFVGGFGRDGDEFRVLRAMSDAKTGSGDRLSETSSTFGRVVDAVPDAMYVRGSVSTSPTAADDPITDGSVGFVTGVDYLAGELELAFTVLYDEPKESLTTDQVRSSLREQYRGQGVDYTLDSVSLDGDTLRFSLTLAGDRYASAATGSPTPTG